MTLLTALVAVLLSTDAAPPGTYRIRTASCPECDQGTIFKEAKAPKSFDCGKGTERDFPKANKVTKCVLKMAKGKKPFHAHYSRVALAGLEEFLLVRDEKGTLKFFRAVPGTCGTPLVESSSCKSLKSADALHPKCVKPTARKVHCPGKELETFSDPRPLSELRCDWAGGDKGRTCKVGAGGVEPLPDQIVVCTPELKCDVAVKKP